MEKTLTQKAIERVQELCREQQWRYEPIIGKQRSADLVERRIVIIKQLRFEGYSFPQIGRAMNRDHTSIMHLACDEFRARRNMKTKTRNLKNAK